MIKNFVAFTQDHDNLIKHIKDYINCSNAGNLSDKKAQELKTAIVNNLMMMINWCDESTALLPNTNSQLYQDKALKIFNDHINPFLTNASESEFGEAQKPAFLKRKSIADSVQRLYEDHRSLYGLTRYNQEEKSKLSDTDFKLGIINFIANIVHDMARFMRKITGRKKLADSFEDFTEKAAKEIRKESLQASKKHSGIAATKKPTPKAEQVLEKPKEKTTYTVTWPNGKPKKKQARVLLASSSSKSTRVRRD